jgi:cytochrome c biogenesis protein ResB
LLVALLVRPFVSWQESGVTLLSGQLHPIGHGQDFAVRTGELIVDHHPEGQPRDLRIPVAILVGTSPPVTETVRINKPLTFRGVNLHLLNYGPGALVTAPEGTFRVALPGGQTQEITLPKSKLRLRLAIQPDGSSLFVDALAADGTAVGSGLVTDGHEISAGGTSISFALGSFTVWQVSQDPTFGWAVVSAALLLVGTLVSLWVPRRRLWLWVDRQGIRMAAPATCIDFEALAAEIALACGPREEDSG